MSPHAPREDAPLCHPESPTDDEGPLKRFIASAFTARAADFTAVMYSAGSAVVRSFAVCAAQDDKCDPADRASRYDRASCTNNSGVR